MSTDGICSVCFENYSNKSTGSPDTCNHLFCLECILTWSKTSDLCPVDRVPFTSVDILHNSKKLAEVKVELKKKKKAPERYDFTRVCDICQNGSKETVVLLCDACDLAFHPKCLDPPLTSIPNGEWYCSTCSSIFSPPKRGRGRPRKYGRVECVGKFMKEKHVKAYREVERNYSDKAGDNVDACPSSAASSRNSSEDESSGDEEPAPRENSQPESFSDLKKKVCLTSDGRLVFNSKNAFNTMLNIVKKELNSESAQKPLACVQSAKHSELTSVVRKPQLSDMQGCCSSSHRKPSSLSLNPKKITIENGSLVFIS